MNTVDMEIALAQHFNSRINIIVPNVSWGFFIHECDLLVVTKSGYAWEVEIKVSKADLIKDGYKKHQHRDNRISRLYFAIPTKLLSCIAYIPAHAGIIEVREDRYCSVIRQAPVNHDYKFADTEKLAIARLGTMRIWTLKKTVRDICNELRQKREQTKD